MCGTVQLTPARRLREEDSAQKCASVVEPAQRGWQLVVDDDRVLGKWADPYLREPSRPLPRNPKPSELLRPEYCVVPFFGREHELEQALGWCTEDGPFNAVLYTGRGGVGKTRFAIELGTRLEERGWVAWAQEEEGPTPSGPAVGSFCW